MAGSSRRVARRLTDFQVRFLAAIERQVGCARLVEEGPRLVRLRREIGAPDDAVLVETRPAGQHGAVWVL